MPSDSEFLTRFKGIETCESAAPALTGFGSEFLTRFKGIETNRKNFFPLETEQTPNS